MKDEGKYLDLWMKYSAVIRLLIKKTETENQKLQLFKHEFENGSHKTITGYAFSVELINGRVMNTVSSTAIAKDLVQVLVSNLAFKTWLKTHCVKISLGKTFDLSFEKIEVPVPL
jgi:hypothetical protein